MKNAINYFYHLNPDNIHKTDDIIYFDLNNHYYVLRVFMGSKEDLNMIYDISNKMYQNGVYIHQIVPNINSEYITSIDNKNYILIESLDKMDRKIEVKDIVEFQNKVNYIKNEDAKNDWANLWSRKIDYFEYQVNQFGINFPLIRKSINYFIGLAENGISSYNNFKINYSTLTISHKRIKYDATLYDLYDPLNLIYDVKSRDFSEYVKDYFFKNKDTLEVVESSIGLFNFNSYELILFYIRMLYPSFYFDLYENIVENNMSEDILKNIIDNISNYELFLRDLYNFLSKYVNLPDIEWIKKVAKLN